MGDEKYYSDSMGQENDNQSESSLPIRRILASLSLDWIPLIFELYKDVKKFLSHASHEGLYETLEYESVVELIDPKGEVALFKKRQRVKFLQDNIIAFQDRAWGEGEFLSDYHCSPGLVVDKYKDGDRWNVVISLRETKRSGDIEEFFMESKIVNGFTKNEEWWQVEMQHQTRFLKVSIIFPKERRCQHAVLLERTRNRSTVLNSDKLADLPDGRQVLTWENKKPKRFETYTIKWTW